MKKKDILDAARARLEEAAEYEAQARRQAQEDLAFVVGDHWTQEDRAAREKAGRPCLTFNQMPQFLRRVTAQIRGMNPAIKVRVADNQASKDTAEIIEGIVRAIEYDSDATAVYEATAEQAAAGGFGHFRIRSVYEDGDTFDQKLLIERVVNPFAVFTDPAAKDPTRKDAQWRIIAEEMPCERFKAEYPDAAEVAFTDEHKQTWHTLWVNEAKDTVTVAEYYWIEYETVKIGLAPDGSVLREWPPEFKPIRVREKREPRVKWAKVSGKEVLEGPLDVPGKFIPVVTVTGEEITLGESSYISSVTRFAKDAQVAYNVAQTANIEMILKQPQAPWLVTPAQVAGHDAFWNKVNSANLSVLPYNPDPQAGPPSRIAPPLASSGLVNMAQMAAEDMKRTTGIYDASLGARSNETSGVAIEARQAESEASNSIYADNLVKAVRQCGMILLGQIPETYDTARALRILGEDGNEKIVQVNGVVVQGGMPQPVNDLRVGNYAVHIAVGKSYDTKRQESAANMLELSRNIPLIGQVAPDLIVRALDVPDGERLADRLAKALPPGMQEDPEEPTPEQQMQKQQQMQQMQQQAQIQQAVMALEMQTKKAQADKAEADAVKARMEAEKAAIEAEQMKFELGRNIGAGHSEAEMNRRGAFAPSTPARA